MAKVKEPAIGCDIDWIAKVYKEIGENDSNQDVTDWLSTGYIPLNKAMSGKPDGGFPVGRISEIYGTESSGKTMLATMALISTQKKGGLAVLLDFEHAFSLSRAKQLGLSTDRSEWIFKQPNTAEAGFKIIEFVAEEVRKSDSKKHITIVIDSVASMMTESELAADYDEQNMKTKLSLPSVMSSSLKKLASLVNNTNITLIFLNQTRDNIGVMFGDKSKTTGGNALKFYCSLRMKLSKTGKIKVDDHITGDFIEATIIKNKVFEPYQVCKYQSSFKEGIDFVSSNIESLKEDGLLGDMKGYVEFEGVKMRQKELEALCRADSSAHVRLQLLFNS